MRGTLGVDIAAEKLKSQGFIILGREVEAWIPGVPGGRRYDLIVQSPGSQIVFGVEVKTTILDQFKLNPSQVAFDVKAIKSGAMTALQIPVRSVMYRGHSFATEPGAVWSTTTLVSALKAAGVGFDYTRSPLP